MSSLDDHFPYLMTSKGSQQGEGFAPTSCIIYIPSGTQTIYITLYNIISHGKSPSLLVNTINMVDIPWLC